MHVAFKRGEQLINKKNPTRRQQVIQFAKLLRAKWEQRDRIEAIAKYSMLSR
jgi:hypothetical protein